MTWAQQIGLAEEQVKTAQEALHLSKQRYKLGLGTVVEVTQSEVAVTAAQTKLAEAQYDYKIAEVTLAYASRGASLHDNSLVSRRSPDNVDDQERVGLISCAIASTRPALFVRSATRRASRF